MVLVVGLGLGFGNNGFFNETGAAFGGLFFKKKMYYFFIFFNWLLILFKVHYINIKKLFYLQHA